MGYHLAGFDVTGVDINRQKYFPFEFIQADALQLEIEFLRRFDAIHASPPCQKYTKKPGTWGRGRVHWTEHPELIEATREMLDEAGRPYVIENLGGAPIRGDMMLCGTMFGLRIIKHRFFETSFPIFELMPPCDHRDTYNPWSGKGRSIKQFREAMGTPWLPCDGGASKKRGATGDISNAIPPAFTQWIGERLLDHLKEAA